MRQENVSWISNTSFCYRTMGKQSYNISEARKMRVRLKRVRDQIMCVCVWRVEGVERKESEKMNRIRERIQYPNKLTNRLTNEPSMWRAYNNEYIWIVHSSYNCWRTTRLLHSRKTGQITFRNAYKYFASFSSKSQVRFRHEFILHSLQDFICIVRHLELSLLFVLLLCESVFSV